MNAFESAGGRIQNVQYLSLRKTTVYQN